MLPNSIPYCGPAPDPTELIWRWNFDPALMVVLAGLATVYGWDAARRVGTRQNEIVAFACAWLLLVLLFVSPLCAWSSSLFSVRVAHHVVLITIVAPLLVLARPIGLRRGLTPVLLLHSVTLWLWHLPALYTYALSSDVVFWGMQLSLLGSAVLLWQCILLQHAEPWKAIVGLVGISVQMGLLGALITFAPTPLYGPHLTTTAAWGLSPLDDQQLAGLIMWVPAMLPYLAAGLWLTSLFLNDAAPRSGRNRA